MDASGANAVNGGISTHKSSDKSMSWQDLKDAVDAAKVIVNCNHFNLQISLDPVWNSYLLSFHLSGVFDLCLLICGFFKLSADPRRKPSIRTPSDSRG